MNLTFLTSKKIIVSSKANFNKISKLYQKKAKIIFATRLIKKISEKPINIKLNYKKEFKILFVGRLESWKGINILLETFYKLNKLNSKKTFKLLIRGDGPLKQNIKEFITTKKLRNKIILLPRQKNLINLYSKASIFFFPSLRETGGMALLESMSIGIPPAVINNGGPGFIVKTNCGIVVDCINKNENQIIDAFVNRIYKLSNNTNKAVLFSKNSHKRVDEFIWNTKLLDIYNL
jgi:glycosyltransferase involved in cell wall biosynthesis